MNINLKGRDRVWIVRAPAERRAFVRVVARADPPLIKGKTTSSRLVPIWTHDRETKALTRSWRLAEAAEESRRRRPRLARLLARRPA